MSKIVTGTTITKTYVRSRLRQVQAVAGAVFSLFVLLHLSNIATAPFGIDIFNDYQRLIRRIYQYPLIEITVVLLPILAHAIAGIWLWLLRRQSPAQKRSWRARLHTWAGCFLLIFIIGHILAVRGSSFFFGVFPEFEGLTFSLWYLPAYFYPYYFLLALAGFYHATHGLRTLAARRGYQLPARLHTGIVIVAAFWFAVSLLALGGVLVDVPNPVDNDFARLSAQLLDMDISKPWK
ncbi:MAG: hypothetical protein HOC70_01460 [Gammaproteobacteria bacterium]|jgi:succinate dehydrogenase/fumarate reductase cytochrome b subunit|nr:hypothetical protein [Gammaproteobacteria bacterium]MBT4491881.1 hypothetical protein [Gammaproteobacteria bacterium]